MTKLQLKNLIKEVIAEASTETGKVWVVVGMLSGDPATVDAVFSSEEKALAFTKKYSVNHIDYIQEVDLDPIN